MLFYIDSQEIKTQFDVLPSSSWKENYRNYEVSRNPGRIEEEQKEEQQCCDKGAYVGMYVSMYVTM